MLAASADAAGPDWQWKLGYPNLPVRRAVGTAMSRTAILGVAAAIGTGAAFADAGCGEDRGEVRFEDRTDTGRTGTTGTATEPATEAGTTATEPAETGTAP